MVSSFSYGFLLKSHIPPILHRREITSTPIDAVRRQRAARAAHVMGSILRIKRAATPLPFSDHPQKAAPAQPPLCRRLTREINFGRTMAAFTDNEIRVNKNPLRYRFVNATAAFRKQIHVRAGAATSRRSTTTTLLQGVRAHAI
ncbi:hypothetical protein EVAR_71241_1 [Eumeta japonica]|uniref:Uncharacterized protein n=1 Tax=Eumeta variegata TaxID=151549 RepID=A0A4C1SAI2_EUMVA|nr:hypothetical protein EVAR_71241_1 [Eumeta japonica]